MSQNQLIELTEAVEAECPVGKAFGVSGIGEGIVWTCVTPGWESSKFWMKVKGEKHSVSKVKTLVDVEALANIQAFLDYAVTEARLDQGFTEVAAKDIKDIAAFLRWMYNDIIKEEADTIEANGLDPKTIGKNISARARPWFIKRINNAYW